mmetsp:Transcript_27476/g.89506  ORF Transcript_27476/g.89506 Transcript_27476/m.89506 type:complete len:310 (+) Transcript_27476:658-1587(+)
MKVLRSQWSSSVTTDMLLSCWKDPKNWTTLGCLSLHNFSTSRMKEPRNSSRASEEDADLSISLTATGEPNHVASQTVPIDPLAMHRCFLILFMSTSHSERRSSLADFPSYCPSISPAPPSVEGSGVLEPTAGSCCSCSCSCTPLSFFASPSESSPMSAPLALAFPVCCSSFFSLAFSCCALDSSSSILSILFDSTSRSRCWLLPTPWEISARCDMRGEEREKEELAASDAIDATPLLPRAFEDCASSCKPSLLLPLALSAWPSEPLLDLVLSAPSVDARGEAPSTDAFLLSPLHSREGQDEFLSLLRAV